MTAVKNSVWKTKDGRIVSIREMTDSHLLNTMRMLERKAESRHNRTDRMKLFLSLPMPNGDGATLAWEQEFSELFEDDFDEDDGDPVPDPRPEDYWPIYKVLKREALRRKLK